MKELSGAGWKKCDKESEVKEEEIKQLFDMIDKDKSGFLSKRVSLGNSYTALICESRIACREC